MSIELSGTTGSRRGRGGGGPGDAPGPKTPTLAVVQTESLTREARLQYAVLLTEERDHVLLFALQPPAQHCHDDVKRKHR